MSPDPADRREVALWGAGMILLVALLWTLRDFIAPPVAAIFLVAVLWPIRFWPGMGTLITGVILISFLWLLDQYGGFLGPFILALGLAYLMAPVVDRLTKRRVPKGLAIILVAVVPIGLVVLLVLLAGPQLWDQVLALSGKVPKVADTVVAWIQGVQDKVAALPFLSDAQREKLGHFDSTTLATFLQSHTDEIVSGITGWGLTVLQRAGTLLGLLGYLVISPIIAFYLVADWAVLMQTLEGLVPPARRPTVIGFITEYDSALGRWLRGQAIEACIVTAMIWIGLAVLGIPSAFLLGLIAGALNTIPFIGYAIAILPALLIGLATDDPGSALVKILIVYAIVNFVDGNITGPRFVGGSVGLHPVVSMLAMALGGTLLGFIGFVLAIPLAVLAKMIILRVMASYKSSGMYGATS